MINEADRKRKLVEEVMSLPGGYAVRVEDRYRVGMLDLIIKLPTFPVIWAEGKMVEGNVFAPTLRQWEEGQKIWRSGMMPLLLGWKGLNMFVSPWTKQADIRTCFFGSGRWLPVLQDYLTLKEPHESRR